MTDDTNDDICGSTDTESDEPCQLGAGWGTDNDDGPCRHHVDDRVRPRKLTHELQERIASDLEAGVPVKHAAPANGIGESTYYEWVQLGEEYEDGVLSDFAERVTRAKSHGLGSMVRDVVSIARDKDDARTLLKAYQQMVDGEKAHEDEDNVVPLVVPENAIPDS